MKERILNALGWHRWFEAWPLLRWSDGTLTGFRNWKGTFRDPYKALEVAGDPGGYVERWYWGKPKPPRGYPQ